jgi:HD-GYP domain-containing protein (c-di-GMP phosphodiesterase class II)
VSRRALTGAGGALDLEPGTPTTFRVELPLRGDPLARLTRELQGQAARADAQALQAIRDFRAAHRRVEEERRVRQQAEAQQLRTVEDFRAEHMRATALARRLDRAYLETITALARAVEARDSYTGGHVERVRSYSLHIADGLRLGGEALRALEVGALLHDVGKIGVQDAILRKPGGLDPEEWDAVRRHPEIGRRVLEGVSFLAPALEGVAYHHERWDGEGYPAGLAGEAIPLAGRIVAVADAYDAMTSDRSYRRGLPTEVALAEIELGRGTQFDPDVAAAFLTWRAQHPG